MGSLVFLSQDAPQAELHFGVRALFVLWCVTSLPAQLCYQVQVLLSCALIPLIMVKGLTEKLPERE